MPPTGSVLLDTNILIALLAGDTGAVSGLRAAQLVYMPVIALGELYYGARRSERAVENTERIARFAAAGAVLPCDGITAEIYGELKAILRSRGTPIPENDLWIATVARQHDLTLITRDAHFELVPDLALQRWGS
jgi:tRNA(fMet)-specific endonuclease VapC